MYNRSQAKLITIYENCGVFICHLTPVSMRYMLSICDFMFRKIFYPNFFQVTVCRVHVLKGFTRYLILLLELISLKKIQPQNPGQRQRVNDVIRIQRLHQLRYLRRICFCILYSIKYKDISMKRPASAHVLLKCRRYIFYSLLRAYCFSNNLIKI